MPSKKFWAEQKTLLEAARQDDAKNGGDSTRKEFAEDFGAEFASWKDPYALNFKDLLENAIPEGREIMNDYRANGETTLLEAGGASSAVAFSDFSRITGQIIYSMIKEQLTGGNYLHTQMVNEKFTPFLTGEKIPGVSMLGDESSVVDEGENYPRAKLSAEYVEVPSTKKRGFIVDVTKEAVFGDRTGLVLQTASQLGESHMIEKEKRFLDLATGITNSYNYNGNAIDTYGDSAGNHDWDNLAASNGLVDYTDIENAILLWDAMSHPITGEPIMPSGYDVLVPSALSMKLGSILNATQYERGDNQANADTIMRDFPNPLNGMGLVPRNNQYVSRRTSSASTWFIGDFRKAFCYLYNHPLTVVQAPSNNTAEFERDIVASFKASERGTYAVLEPRYVVKCTA